VNRLKQQLSSYKKEMEEAQNKYSAAELKSESSEEPSPYNQQLLNKLLESGTSLPSAPTSPKSIQ
jgi:hypothetical protein